VSAPSIVVAGGHSAGHIEPALAVADAARRLEPDVRITALGTVRGLDTRLIPARGYDLELIPPVPLPRQLNPALLRLPANVWAAVRAAEAVLDKVSADVVVGFGGYIALPAYLAARARHIPIVVHEANARAGVANRIGAGLTRHVFTASADVHLRHGTAIGIPLRPAIAGLDRAALRAEARRAFGLDPDLPTLLVTGGSQGAQSINHVMAESANLFSTAGVQVLHIVGPKNSLTPAAADGGPHYISVPFVDRMDLAYAAADFVVCRSGAITCAELSAVGLPAAYVPLPLRGGEQRHNAERVVRAGGALLVDNSDFSRQWIRAVLLPCITDPARLAAMAVAAAGTGSRDADVVLARWALALARDHRSRAGVREGSTPAPISKPHPPAGEAMSSHSPSGSSADRPASSPTSDASADRPFDWAAPGAALVRSAATDVVPPLADLGRVHIMGIAGAGMSGLARILIARGVQVSGCEARESATVAALRAVGATVTIGHSADHIDTADSFVYTTAINPNHPEFVAARASGKPFLRRAAALEAALEDRKTIAIAGTHGKTTTTSLLTVAAQACGLDPSFAIGGNLYESGVNAHLGSGELAIVEADESDGSFLLMHPSAAIITNVEADHLENHGDLEGIFRAFEQFVDRITPGGLLFTSADDPGARRIAEYARGRGLRVLSYGEAADADVVVSDVLERPDGVDFVVGGADLPSTQVGVGALIGRHMAHNAAAALALAAELGMDVATVVARWGDFAGVHRRFERHGEAGGVRVYDDYAHHPTEVAAVLGAARAVVGDGRLIAVFQPGTYSRTQTFATEFAHALALADIACVLDIFPAREEPIPGVTGALIAEQVPLPADQVIYEPSFAAVPARISAVALPGDLVLTMGIGNVYLLCSEILSEILTAADEAATEAAAKPGSS
jgi:UDP-N-acetylmuramate--alanine ligase